MPVLSIQDLEVKMQSRLRVVVAGAEKRPVSTMSLNISLTSDTYYILKLIAPYPLSIFQYSYLKFEAITTLESHIRANYRMLFIPTLDDKPADMNIYDAKKNKTKMI